MLKKLHQLFKLNVYEFRDERIIKNKGLFKKESVSVKDIKDWWVLHEMGLDVVFITLNNGDNIQWFDYYNDLLDILAQHAPEKKRN